MIALNFVTAGFSGQLTICNVNERSNRQSLSESTTSRESRYSTFGQWTKVQLNPYSRSRRLADEWRKGVCRTVLTSVHSRDSGPYARSGQRTLTALTMLLVVASSNERMSPDRRSINADWAFVGNLFERLHGCAEAGKLLFRSRIH